MRIVNYPALFHSANNESYWITFPDFKNVFSQGEDFNDAIKMSIDALTLELASLESEGIIFPNPSGADSLTINDNEKLVYVSFDYDEQKKAVKSFKSVKKTLTIPQWLNEAAVQAGINFSAVLQKGLKSELGIKN